MKEIISKFPKATAAAKDFYFKKLMMSFEEQNDVPEDFKEYAKEVGISDENFTMMMEAAPRQLFDLFDSHEIYVEIGVVDGEGGFRWRINGSDWSSKVYKTRMESEVDAVSKAYEMLNDKL
jgi:hypothetical protein